jgi:hypothetical protein
MVSESDPMYEDVKELCVSLLRIFAALSELRGDFRTATG